MKRYLTALLLVLTLFSGAAFAVTGNQNNTLTLTIVNNTGMELIYTHATGQNPGNYFTLLSKGYRSNDIVIEGVTTQDTDIAASLHFTDALGHDHAMLVIDPRNKHIMQPAFSMHNAHLQSTVVSKVRGDNTDPNGLFLAGAVVQINTVG